jgi:hypothetical protein
MDTGNDKGVVLLTIESSFYRHQTQIKKCHLLDIKLDLTFIFQA